MPYKDPAKQRAYKKAWRERNPGREKRSVENHPERFKHYHDAHKEQEKLSKQKWYQMNAEERRAYRKAYAAANPEKIKDYHYRSKYGITYAEKQARIAAQDFRCASCGTGDPKGRGEWHTDHDHLTEELRGELCSACNHALGLLGDDPERIQMLLAYRLKYKIGPTTELGSKSLREEVEEEFLSSLV